MCTSMAVEHKNTQLPRVQQKHTPFRAEKRTQRHVLQKPTQAVVGGQNRASQSADGSHGSKENPPASQIRSPNTLSAPSEHYQAIHLRGIITAKIEDTSQICSGHHFGKSQYIGNVTKLELVYHPQRLDPWREVEVGPGTSPGEALRELGADDSLAGTAESAVWGSHSARMKFELKKSRLENRTPHVRMYSGVLRCSSSAAKTSCPQSIPGLSKVTAAGHMSRSGKLWKP
ncbi:hypothetical protein R3P38DRAFT_2770902 [Favolaschia claudopus]|uniref:Uncharacterized protein n=1 Tax=Favolaschia claudopus TaxID=2862362 RepID=A0AAW0CFC8_9AGAR